MQAKDSVEGQRYILPKRIGEKIVGIQSGWNHNKEYILFLLEKGATRTMKVVMPTEEIQNV